MTDKRLFDYLYDQLNGHPLERAFGAKKDGNWVYVSTAQMLEWVNRASLGFLRLGLRPGDKVATLVYKTTPEWVAIDYALLQIGVLNVPMYPTISSREYEYILGESEAAVAKGVDQVPAGHETVETRHFPAPAKPLRRGPWPPRHPRSGRAGRRGRRDRAAPASR